MWISFDSSGDASISFNGVSASAEFKLLLQSTAQQDTSYTFGVGNIAVSPDFTLPDPAASESEENPGEFFHSLMREEEKWLSETEQESIDAAYVKSISSTSVAKTIPVGKLESFRVLSSLSSTAQYTTVLAEAKCVQGEVAVYVDTRMEGSSALTSADISTLCSMYATDVVADKNIFGAYPDSNEDGAVVALLTPAVNELGASGGGIITGFFYAGDLFSRSDSIPASNEREIVYLMVPDPNGVYGTAISNSFAMSNLLPAVFAHEVQHLISYHQHVFVSGGSSEENWLNEGLSHFAEDVNGRGMENPSRYDLTLSSLPSISLVASGSPNLQERGASFMFIRFLYEQAPNATTFLQNIVQTNKRGVANVENAFAGTSTDFDEFEEFLKRWGVALTLTDTGLTTDSRFIYDARTTHSTGEWEGVCMICDAEDGRGTVLTGPTTTTYSSSTTLTVAGSGTRILEISDPPSTLDIEAANTTSAMQGVLIRVE